LNSNSMSPFQLIDHSPKNHNNSCLQIVSSLLIFLGRGFSPRHHSLPLHHFSMLPCIASSYAFCSVPLILQL
jgi:hypothetical protein